MHVVSENARVSERQYAAGNAVVFGVYALIRDKRVFNGTENISPCLVQSVQPAGKVFLLRLKTPFYNFVCT
jgi:hypothetical protein